MRIESSPSPGDVFVFRENDVFRVFSSGVDSQLFVDFYGGAIS